MRQGVQLSSPRMRDAMYRLRSADEHVRDIWYVGSAATKPHQWRQWRRILTPSSTNSFLAVSSMPAVNSNPRCRKTGSCASRIEKRTWIITDPIRADPHRHHPCSYFEKMRNLTKN